MLLAQSFQYKGYRVCLTINRLANSGNIHINDKLEDSIDTTDISQLRRISERMIDLEEDGNIFNTMY